MRKTVLAMMAGAAIAALAFAIGLVAQPLAQNQLSGNECWNAGQGAGGPTAGFLCVNVIRGGSPVSNLATVTGSLTIGAATGNFTYSTGSLPMTNLATGGDVIVVAQPSAATWTWPALPVTDGAIVGVCNGTTSAFATNAQTPAANTGQTMNITTAFTTLAAGACIRYQWSQATLTWYKIT
jgi:hypothetical protein